MVEAIRWHRGSHWTPLRAAGDGSLWRSRHCPRFFWALQHEGGDRRSGPKHRKGKGDAELMAELQDLNQELILEHAKASRNFRVLAAPDTKPKASILYAAINVPYIS